jgi:hypothetical protein
MKPFDLKKALAGEPVITRDGRPVKIAGYNPDAADYSQVLGWTGKYCDLWYADGSSEFGDEEYLFMAPTERVEWVVVWTNNRGDRCAQVYREENGAKFLVDSLSKDIDATIHKITITE